MVESDCLQVIQALKTRAAGFSEFHLILDDILELSSKLVDFVWSFVKRSGNKVAYVLAHFQPLNFGHHSWVEDIPENIVSIAEFDLIN